MRIRALEHLPGCFSWTMTVRSPPSSRIMFGALPPAKAFSCASMHSTYSASVSPFQAKTGTPVFAMAAAAWSCVEKMLQLVQVTSAPSAVSVSMSTAVWMVMWRHPATRAPFSGLAAPYSLRMAMRPGISLSAISISLRPQSASVDVPLTLKFSAMTMSLRAPCSSPLADARGFVVVLWFLATSSPARAGSCRDRRRAGLRRSWSRARRRGRRSARSGGGPRARSRARRRPGRASTRRRGVRSR